MDLSELKFDSNGLIPVIAFDVETNQVVMLAYMNAEAVQRTAETGLATYWSRSRQKFWVKGETSGHTQEVRWIRMDCDADTLLIGVKQNIAACHNGYFTCFYRELRDGAWEVVQQRVFDPDEAYGR